MSQKENPSGLQAAPGHSEKQFMRHFCIIPGLKNQLKKRIAKYSRPRIAGIFTRFKFSNKTSLFLDRLLIEEEGGDYDGLL